MDRLDTLRGILAKYGVLIERHILGKDDTRFVLRIELYSDCSWVLRCTPSSAFGSDAYLDATVHSTEFNNFPQLSELRKELVAILG